ncbi:MAG: flagellar basal body rod protein FlgB [Defluviitaleaceae bacterium]|nr:flagellar basal body rod protein FlgB [Defluviitaleaceae bacterium]
MIFDAMFRQNNILGAASNAANVRNEVIVNNIANADVPGFKSKAVDFEASLAEAIDRYRQTGNLDLSGASPSIRLTNENYNYRIDKNNVDMELEMVNLYQNAIKFETFITCMQSNSKRLSMALTGR